jgi:hypothetical protein
MRKFLLLSFILAGLVTSVKTFSQVSVTATAGTASATYSSLGNAFNAINAGTHKGVITITLTASTTEATTAKLDSSGNPTTSSYTSVTIKPAAATAVTLSGTVSGTPMIDLNGADGVVFDGLNTGGASLTLNNTDVLSGTSSTLRLINDASNNKFLNLTIKGAAPATAASAATAVGSVFLSSGLLTGNDGNRFTGCNFDGTGSAGVLFASTGTTTAASNQNSADTVSNCNFYDFFNATLTSSYGLYLYQGSTDWIISGNSFYQTTNRSTAQQGVHTSLTIFPSWTTDTHQVLNNYSGGNAPNAAGSVTYTGSSTNVVGYIGFNVQTGGPNNLVQGNFCRNVTVNYSGAAGSFGNYGFTAFIGGYDGTSTFTGNTVTNFTISNSGGSALGGAMAFNGRVTAAGVTQKPVFTVTNNTITNVTFNAGGTGSAQYYAIRLEASSAASLTSATTISNPYFIVTGNNINNIGSATGGAAGWVRGIGTVVTNGSASTCALFPKELIQNNTINDVTCFSSTASYTSPTVAGIYFPGSGNVANTVDTIFMTGNTIYNLSSTNTADLASLVTGIYASTGIHYINRNRIYGLANQSAGTVAVPVVSAIDFRSAVGSTTSINSNIVNNFISLGTSQNTNTNFFGILNNFSSSNPINVYYNSIYMGGVAGTRSSAALYRGNETMSAAITTQMNIKDNILYNTRAAGAGNYAIASYGTGTWTSDYNVLVNSSNVNSIAFWNNASNDLATYRTNSGGDANSKNVTVNFVNTATADLHLTGASTSNISLAGNPITGYTTDYDNQSRSSFNPFIGADEAAGPLPVQLISFNGAKDGKVNKLQWSTSSESNNRGFELERSADGKNFSSIAFVQTKAENGTSNSTISYSFSDERATNATTYYRLKQVDRDGKITYSSATVVIKGDKYGLEISAVYPNPARERINLSITSGVAEKASISITDLNGRVVKQLNINLNAGDNYINLDINSLAPGSYVIRLINSQSEPKTAQFIKN